jgi:hypothetical protein
LKSKIKRGDGARGLINYLLQGRKGELREPRGELIGGTLSGRDPRAIAAEVGHFRKLRPEVKRPIHHLSLRLPAGDRDLNNEEWLSIARDALSACGANPDILPHVVVRHKEKEGDHIHILSCRVYPDGSLFHGRNDNLKLSSACRDLELKYNLQLTPGPPRRGEQPRPDRPRRRAIEGAQRAAARRGQQLKPAALAAAVRQAVGAARDRDELQAALQERGIECEFSTQSTGRVAGWKLRQAGGSEWLKASSLARDLSWSKVARRLQENKVGNAPAMREKTMEKEHQATAWVRARELMSQLDGETLKKLAEDSWHTRELQALLLYELVRVLLFILTAGAARLPHAPTPAVLEAVADPRGELRGRLRHALPWMARQELRRRDAELATAGEVTPLQDEQDDEHERGGQYRPRG